MKKAGFTLAEVLITLTIIGVVAMMTLPALITNVGEQQSKTGLKKGINTLSEAAQLSNALANFDFSSLRADLTAIDANSPETQTMTGLLLARTSVDVGKSNLAGAAQTEAVKKMQDTATGSAVAKGDFASGTYVFFRDGSCIAYNAADTTTNNTTNGVILTDGLPRGFTVLYDINGEKGPNELSNCDAKTNETKDNGVSYTTIKNNTDFNVSANTCATKADRRIRDEFLLQLRGSTIVPAHAAAVWTASN